jgi:N utilization substance protein B
MTAREPQGVRRRGRECALKVLYSLDLNPHASVEQALTSFWRQLATETGDSGEVPGDPDTDASVLDPEVVTFADFLVRNTMEDLVGIDDRVQRASRNWRLERMARVDRNLLRLGCFELGRGADVPARVVINEAIELAKRFGTAESPAFINGVLYRIADEFGGAPPKDDEQGPPGDDA